MRSTPQKRNQFIKDNCRAEDVQSAILAIYREKGIEIFDEDMQETLLSLLINEIRSSHKSQRESRKRFQEAT